jgi:ABC-type lipoprotein release transport system permease subunit
VVSRPDTSEETLADQHIITPTFFETMHVPVVAGVAFGAEARPTDPLTIVVSDTLARREFGSAAAAIGRPLRVGMRSEPRLARIIGVVGDAVLTSPQRRNTALVYVNFFQMPDTLQEWPYLVVRVRREAATTNNDIRQAVERSGREWVPRMRTLRAQRDVALAQEQLLAALSSAYGVLGLLLAAVGLYGLFSFLVTQRVREIGVRLALGAGRGQVVGLFMREAVTLVGLGVTIGVPAAWAATRATAAILSGKDAGASIAVAVTLLVAVSLLAVWVPARRAASLEPMFALRHD